MVLQRLWSDATAPRSPVTSLGLPAQSYSGCPAGTQLVRIWRAAICIGKTNPDTQIPVMFQLVLHAC